MTDKPDTRSSERAWSGALNGVMFILVGVAVPLIVGLRLFLWSHDSAPMETWQTFRGVASTVLLAAFSFWALRTGLRLIRKNAAVLRGRSADGSIPPR